MPRSYPRLACLTLALSLAVASSFAGAPASGEVTPAITIDEAVASHYPPVHLNLENFSKLMKAEKALSGTLRDSKLERALAMHGDPDTLRRWQVQVESDKKAVEAIRGAGLDPHGYVRTLVAVLQAYGVSGLKKQGKTVPESLAAQIPPENLAFVEKHAAEIEKWGQATGKGPVKPNTMEDIYVEQASPAVDAPKTAVAGDAAGAANPAPAKTAPTTSSKKSAKDPAKPAPKPDPSAKP